MVPHHEAGVVVVRGDAWKIGGLRWCGVDENDRNVPLREERRIFRTERQRRNHAGRPGFDQPLDDAILKARIVDAVHGDIGDDNRPVEMAQRLLNAGHQVEIV